MKRRIVTFLIVCISTWAYAQTESTRDTIRVPKPVVPTQPTQKGEEHPDKKVLPDSLKPAYPTPRITTDTMTFVVPEFEYTPYPLPIPRLGEGGNLFARDYNLSDHMALTDNMYISTWSNRNTYVTMGNIVDAGGAYTIMPNDRWSLTGGAYTMQYTMPSRYSHGSRFDAGIVGSLAYRINDQLRIKTYGQYSLYGQRNAEKGLWTPMYPQSKYGMTLELKVTESFGIEGGMERQFNPYKMKWVNVPVFSPVFYIKR